MKDHQPGELISTLVVFTTSGPITCTLRATADQRIEATTERQRWVLRYDSLARFLSALSDDDLPSPR